MKITRAGAAQHLVGVEVALPTVPGLEPNYEDVLKAARVK